MEIAEQIEKGIGEVKTLVSAEVKTLSDRIEKIEKSPIITAPNLSLKFPSAYKGYSMDQMGGQLEDIAFNSKNPKRFKVFSNGEKMYAFKKWMIDVTKALRGDYKTAMELKAGMNETTDAQGGYLVPD